MQPHIPPGGFSLVFVDPPYEKQLAEGILEELAQQELVAANGLLVVESSASSSLPEKISVFALCDQRSYGEAGFWLYRKKELETD